MNIFLYERLFIRINLTDVIKYIFYFFLVTPNYPSKQLICNASLSSLHLFFWEKGKKIWSNRTFFWCLRLFLVIAC